MATPLEKTALAGSIFILAWAIFGNWNPSSNVNDKISKLLESLKRAEKEVTITTPPKIAIGFGACSDIFVDATALLQTVGIKPLEETNNYDIVSNVDELSQSFSRFFQRGAAAERYVDNATLFALLVRSSYGVKGVKTSIGGVGPLMANRLALSGAKVLVAAPPTEEFRGAIDPRVRIVGSSAGPSDIHLLMEYKVGDRFGKFKSPRANRFSLHADIQGSLIQSLEPFMEEYKTFKPDLLVIGGLQMDNFPFKSGEREARLSALQGLLKDANSNEILTHFEMTSLVEEALMVELSQKVFPFCDSMGMNEQELANLVGFLRSGEITTVAEAYSALPEVLDQIRDTYKLLWRLSGRVSRLHVHTLPFQAILTRKSSQWKNCASAAAKAALTAHRYVCSSEVVNTSDSKLLMEDSFLTSGDADHSRRISLDPESPVSCWEEEFPSSLGVLGGAVVICVAPNPVCTKVTRTAGAGDNISGAGLVLQI